MLVAPIIKKRENCRCLILLSKARVMLIGEIVIRQLERRLIATQLPDNGPVRAGNLVYAAGMSCRHKVVAFGILIDGIDVKNNPKQYH